MVFRDTSDLEAVLNGQEHSTLTGWFRVNEKFPSDHCITYTNFPDKFVWDKSKHKLKERMKGHGTMIIRVYPAHPGEGEHFYLRMLLNHVTGVPVTRIFVLYLMVRYAIHIRKQPVNEVY